MSTGVTHGEIVMNLGGELRNFVRPRRLGRIIGSDSGILLERDPTTVREPDIAFISAEQYPLGTRVSGYYEGVPELVVEIASPTPWTRLSWRRRCHTGIHLLGKRHIRQLGGVGISSHSRWPRRFGLRVVCLLAYRSADLRHERTYHADC